jgi:chromosome partitioning protein
MAVVAVFNQKGGVGKTTTTFNLTAGLARADLHPIGIDLDPQSHLTLSSGIPEIPYESCVSSFFLQGKPLDRLLQDTPAGWQIIPASLTLSKIDAMFGNDPKAALRLKGGLQQELALTGAPVLIDCCPMLGVLTLNALLAADRVLIPVAADFLSLQGVHRIDAALNVLENKLKRKFERRVVVTRFDSRRKLSFEIFDKLKNQYGEQLCASRIGESVALASSPMYGKDVYTYAPHSPGANDFRALTIELLQSGFFSN